MASPIALYTNENIQARCLEYAVRADGACFKRKLQRAYNGGWGWSRWTRDGDMDVSALPDAMQTRYGKLDIVRDHISRMRLPN